MAAAPDPLISSIDALGYKAFWKLCMLLGTVASFNSQYKLKFHQQAQVSPQSSIIAVPPGSCPQLSTRLTGLQWSPSQLQDHPDHFPWNLATSIPSITRPKTQCLPSRWGQAWPGYKGTNRNHAMSHIAFCKFHPWQCFPTSRGFVPGVETKTTWHLHANKELRGVGVLPRSLYKFSWHTEHEGEGFFGLTSGCLAVLLATVGHAKQSRSRVLQVPRCEATCWGWGASERNRLAAHLDN